MPDEKKYTERDLVMAKREGYERAKNASGLLTPYGIKCARIEAVAAYPLPKRTRPRVVKGGSLLYRITDGKIECRLDDKFGLSRWGGSSWSCRPLGEARAEDVEEIRAILDLLANPTEEVDDE